MRSVSVRLEDLKTMIMNLGFAGENEHTRVTVDCKKLYDQYPNASASLTVQPPEGEAYPAVIERDGDFVIWDVMDSDLIAEGSGELQLSFTQEPHLAKSYIGRFKVGRSIIPTGEVPEPLNDFLTRAGAALTGIPETINSALAAAKASGEFDGPQGPAGQDGADGQDGFSPVVTVSAITGGHQVSVTDAEGTETFDVMDGADGQDGAPGQDGVDGVTPEISIGTVTSGSTPAASMDNTDPAHPVLSLTLQKGDKGDTGAAAPAEQVVPAVNAYLASVITNPDSPPLDRSLSSSSAAAPADMVGDLKSAIDEETGTIIADNYIVTDNLVDFTFDYNDWLQGTPENSAVVQCIHNKNKINVSQGDILYCVFNNVTYNPGTIYAALWTYDSGDTLVATVDLLYKNSAPSSYTIPEGVAYAYYGFNTKATSRQITPAVVKGFNADIYIGKTNVNNSTWYEKYIPKVDKSNENIATIEGNISGRGTGVRLELGYVYQDVSGFHYTNSDAGKKIRTPSGVLVTLNPLDKMVLDSDDYEMQATWHNLYDGTYSNSVWYRRQYVAHYMGEYAVMIKRSDDGLFTDADKAFIYEHFKIVKNTKYQREIFNNISSRFPIVCVAHRGLITLAPENTTISARLALEYGFAGVETDAQFTADGKIVAFHDSTVDRVTDGSGNVSDLTLAELKSLHFIGADYANYPDAKVATLEEIVKTVKDNGGYLHMDLGGGKTSAQIAEIYNVIANNGMTRKTFWAANYAEVLAAIKDIDANAPLLLTTKQADIDDDLESIINSLTPLKTGSNRVFVINELSVSTTDEQIADIIAAGLEYAEWKYGPIETPHSSATLTCTEQLPSIATMLARF